MVPVEWGGKEREREGWDRGRFGEERGEPGRDEKGDEDVGV